MEIDDGVIKYDNSLFKSTPSLDEIEYREIEIFRKKMFQLKLIGEYKKEQVGYGNISQRKDYRYIYKSLKPQFIISGTQTGKFSNLNGDHYSRVVDYDTKTNAIVAHGPINASSEALTHAAIYECSSLIKCVIHIHHTQIWQGMIEQDYSSTHEDIP